MLKQVAIYVRKSSTQETKQTNSHARQESEIESFCKRNSMVITKRFYDSSTGTNNNRPGFQKMIKWLDKNAGHVVVMNSVSRLARNQSVWTHIEDRLTQFRFVEFGDQVPTDLMVGIFLSVAKEESKKISDRVKSAYKSLKEKHGDALRWGNDKIGQYSQMGVDERRRRMIEHWSEILITDASFYKVMGWNQKTRLQKLNSMGHKTRTGKQITRQALIAAHHRLGTGGVKTMSEDASLWQGGV